MISTALPISYSVCCRASVWTTANCFTSWALTPAYTVSQSTDYSAAGLVNRHWATRDVAITRSWVGSSTVYGSLRDAANSEPVDFRMTRSVSPPTTHSSSLSTVTAAVRTS
jgi:hypothetical protein